MENEARLRTPEDFREAIGVLARGLSDLQEVVQRQGELMMAMDQKIQLQVKLIDHQAKALAKLGAISPRPIVGLAN